MNTKMLAMFLFGELLSLSCAAQGIFQNLNFESAIVVPVPGDPTGRLQFVPAFPGWTGFINNQQQSTALYNDLFLGSSAFALMGPGGSFHLEGNFTPVLQASSLIVSFPTEVALSQTGQVPSDSLSLRFLATDPAISPNAHLSVSLNGTPLNLAVLQSFSVYNLYGADVSSFAGQLAELRIANVVNPGQFGNLYLDALSFSSSAIPEPSPWTLFALGSALFWCAACRRRK